MKSYVIILMVLMGMSLATEFKYGKSGMTHRNKNKHHKHRQSNDDDKKLINVLTKVANGEKITGVKTIVKKNEQFASLDDLHSLDFEKVGEVRQGYLLRYSGPKNKIEDLNVITLEPTFVVVNTETLSMYQNENINSLMESLPLKDLKMTLLASSKPSINKIIAGHNFMTCFEITLGNAKNFEDIFCLESKMAAKNWIDAI